MRVRLLRACCFGGTLNPPGTEIEIDDRYLVREMVFTGKAEEVGAKAPAPSGPMKTDSVPALVKGKAARKGAEQNAGQ